MTFIITVVKFILNVVYLFFKLFKKRKQITLISRLSNTITTDFVLLSNGLKKALPDYKVVVLCKKLDNKLAYIFHMLRQMYHISRSEVVVIDSYCILDSSKFFKRMQKNTLNHLNLFSTSSYKINKPLICKIQHLSIIL